jgi:hypothetical protein
MSQNQSKDDKAGSLKDLVSFIKNQKPKEYSGPSVTRGSETPVLLSISRYGSMRGIMPPFCTLIDNNLTCRGKCKKLTNQEMERLYQYILEKHKRKEFDYFRLEDLGIMDGNCFDFISNWRELNFSISGGNSMPKGISELIDHIEKILA